MGAGRFHLDKETSLWELNAPAFFGTYTCYSWDSRMEIGESLWEEGCRLGRGQLTFRVKDRVEGSGMLMMSQTLAYFLRSCLLG